MWSVWVPAWYLSTDGVWAGVLVDPVQFGEEAGGEDHSGDLEEGDTDADTAHIHCSRGQTGLLNNLNKMETLK